MSAPKRSTGDPPPMASIADDLARVPPYPFASLEEQARGMAQRGRPVLRFAVGDPDLPPPEALLEGVRESLSAVGAHAYSTSRGEPSLRGAIATWMRARFGVSVDPQSEVAVLLGTKEGLTALPRALLNRGDSVAVPDPGYPAYSGGAILGGYRVERFPLDPEAGWTPIWSRLRPGARLAYLNYPNNPTGQVAGKSILKEAIEEARDRRMILAFDNAYSEITFGDAPAPSLLQIPGGRDVGVEFHSFSKTFGVPGWRLGFAVGNATILDSLVRLKSQVDSGAPTPLQRAAIRGLQLYSNARRPAAIEANVAEYRARSECLSDGLRELGETFVPPAGTLYLWQQAKGGSGTALASQLLKEHAILVTPGEAFGVGGSGYVRWAITRPRQDIVAALSRLRSASNHSAS
jgi:LL-diaminopimelate aminotransferase